jgi:cell division protein FtsW (lipid II flippase)
MIRKLLKFNWIIFAAMIALITIGTVAIWSAGNARAEAIFHDMWINNLVTALFGLVIYFALAFTDYRKVLDLVAVPAYIAAIVMLIAVLIFGLTVDGGKRWLWFFQPSEISKVCIIMFIAWLFGGDTNDRVRVLNGLRLRLRLSLFLRY